jgi:predicted CXXCH cytochrome family protein
MKRNNLRIITIIGIIAVCLAALTLPGTAAMAGSEVSDGHPQDAQDRDCKDCHLEIKKVWSESPHAHAFDDEVFNDRWTGMGSPIECLVCHTTSYDPESGFIYKEGVDCEACHGEPEPDHPKTANKVFADEYYCGSCHTTTLSEWRLTGHKRAGVGCIDCHDPHSQQNLFENPDDLCINCHKDDMGDYLEDLHIQKNIGCIDCHALVIPPEVPPQDGIVPTGHGFTITVPTCVACHTDSLHAGFSLPGYESGAKNANNDEILESELLFNDTNNNGEAITDQELGVIETASATNTIINLFQGAVIGLALGGSTAWIVSLNYRKRSEAQDISEEEE